MGWRAEENLPWREQHREGTQPQRDKRTTRKPSEPEERTAREKLAQLERMNASPTSGVDALSPLLFPSLGCFFLFLPFMCGFKLFGRLAARRVLSSKAGRKK